MKVRIEDLERASGWLIRFFGGRNDRTVVAYIVIGLSGLQFEVETPSDWHERRRAWLRIGFGLGKVCASVPWPFAVPEDDGQCSGPTFGFNFFGDGLHLHWGKQHGRRGDQFTILPMPWQWRHIERAHKQGDPETHPYAYRLRSGEVQERSATVKTDTRAWWRPWPPFYRRSDSIDVEFDAEVGERTGSWKGGVMGCGYEMRRGEAPVDTLRRMERERVFS